jgi:hypothetical protein
MQARKQTGTTTTIAVFVSNEKTGGETAGEDADACARMEPEAIRILPAAEATAYQSVASDVDRDDAGKKFKFEIHLLPQLGSLESNGLVPRGKVSDWVL